MQITIDHNYASCNSHDEIRQNNLYYRSVSIITDYYRNDSLLLYVSRHILPKARTIKFYDNPSGKNVVLFLSNVWTATHDTAVTSHNFANPGSTFRGKRGRAECSSAGPGNIPKYRPMQIFWLLMPGKEIRGKKKRPKMWNVKLNTHFVLSKYKQGSLFPLS